MENNYLVSARKYRPAAFESVVGQAHVTETLEHEVLTGRLAQALLFTGPRGVGKTTCARILARRINEVHTGEGLDYSLNIFELDGASNNTVDDIRQLIDQVRFAPQMGKYKVYIIDEVHMLSQAAFNAFLKTLEEPPAHAIFILATTEKHKVLPTILSRCQIFDFKRIGISDIADHLQWVAGKEGLVAEQEALHAIAEKADGSLRDSLSIFDRIAAFAQGGPLTYDLVRRNLQLVDRALYVGLWNQIMAADRASVLTVIQDVLDEGFDLQRFLMGFAGYVRELLLAQHPATVALLDLPDSAKNALLDASHEVSAARAASALKRLVAADAGYRSASNARWHVEVALLDLILDEPADEKKKPSSSAAQSASVAEPEPRIASSAEPETTASTIEHVALAPQTEPIPEPQSAVLPELEPESEPMTEPEPMTESESEPEPVLMPFAVESAALSSLQEPIPSSLPAAEVAPVAVTNTPNARVHRTAFSLKGLGGTDYLVPDSPEPETRADQVIDPTAASIQAAVVERQLRPFSQTALDTAWSESAGALDDLPVIKAIVQQVQPVLEDESVVRVSLENELQEDYLNSVRDRILPFLRQALNNDSITVRTQVQVGSVNARLVYTPDERFAFLLEKNPHLDDFREQFQLDIE
ncbi:MAG: DNA polymerase III subunit gamma/tau [Cryomorphaceae bacterium]|nr:DNA polymerase III subunit gamma/tau [Cryomorphaceae bacterium]